MSDLPQVSVIMPAYNAAPTIGAAIQSVLDQSFAEFELIVVDDCSTDQTAAIVNGFADARITLLSQSENGGVAMARNRGLEAAQERYIAFLDSDDLWAPEKLTKQVALLSTSSANCCHTAYFRFSQSPDEPERKRVAAHAKVTYRQMLTGNRIGNLTGLYDCQAVGKVMQRPIGHEDYLMWATIVQQTDSIGIDEPLAYYRSSANSLSGSMLRSAGWHHRILREELGLSAPAAAFRMLQYAAQALGKRIGV